GTFQMLDEQDAFPVNHVKVECVQQEGYCRLDEIDVGFPKEEDFAPDFTIYRNDNERYKITNWTDDVVEADSEVSPMVDKPCRNTKLQLNFKAKEYYMITTNAGEKGCEIFGQKIGKLEKPRISRIVDGEKLMQAESDAFRKKQYEMLASECRNQIASAV